MNYKIAFTGSSGSGKTTLVNYVVENNPDIKHLSSSAGDLLTSLDKICIKCITGYQGDGHKDTIVECAKDYKYGMLVQNLIRIRRDAIISNFRDFVTDRSPVDNLTYFINQVGFHPEVNDEIITSFYKECHYTLSKLTHLVYIKAVQPHQVENNGSRIHNWYYQKAIDAQFDYWLKYLMGNGEGMPKVLVIDYWDLDKRKEAIDNFLRNE